MSLISTVADSLLDEARATIKEWARETENAIKERLRNLLISAIVVTVLSALVTLLLGGASIFLVIGLLDYLSSFMPRWEAWGVIGLISGIAGILLLLVLFLSIRKQFRPTPARYDRY